MQEQNSIPKEKVEIEHCVIETTGNMWEYFYSGEAAIVIPTNGNLNQFGHNVMQTGLGRDAKHLFPILPKLLGKSIKRHKGHNQVNVYRLPTDKVINNQKQSNFIFTFPTKYNFWDEKADLKLIELSAQMLVQISEQFFKQNWIDKIVLPTVGCGDGHLDWETEVKPILVKILDERFLVVKHEIDVYGDIYGDLYA
jgi:hypothetical protein